MKLTPWYPAEVKPVHVGAYLSCEYLDGADFYRYWDGARWGAAARTIPEAILASSTFACQTNQWRGLQKPKKHGGQETHGMSYTRVYKVWTSMKTRCQNPHDKKYPIYGGRGISVCDEWAKFENFISDMGVPNTGMTLERRDGNKGYNKDNCKWATAKEQNRNLASNVLSIEIARHMRQLATRGYSVKQIAELTGTNYMNSYDVVVRGRWSEQP